MDPAKAKLLFYTLLEAASRYRESYWREELEQFEKDARDLLNKIHDYNNASNKVKRIIESKVKSIVLGHQSKLERFNNAMYTELEAVKKAYKEQSYTLLDDFVTAYALMAEELDKCDNTTNLLAVCQLYNQGHLSGLRGLIEHKSNELNAKYQNHETPNNIPFGDNPGTAYAELSEEQSKTLSGDKSTS